MRNKRVHTEIAKNLAEHAEEDNFKKIK